MATPDARWLAAFVDRAKTLAVRRCLSADASCVGPIVRAHSVQNAVILGELAEDGHVYTFLRAGTGTKLTRIGRNQATTFTGYCAHHDGALFRSIDFRSPGDFLPGDNPQAARFALRALAREYSVKLTTIEVIREAVSLARASRVDELKRLHNMTDDEVHRFTTSFRFTLVPFLGGLELSLRNFGGAYNSLLASTRRTRFHLWRFHSWSLACAPSVAASAPFYPEYDARGTLLATRLPHEDTPVLVLNVFPLGHTTWILLAHHRRFEARLAGLVRDLNLLGPAELGVFVSRTLLVHCENTVFAPRYLSALSSEVIHRMEAVFDATMFNAEPYHLVPEFNFFATR